MELGILFHTHPRAHVSAATTFWSSAISSETLCIQHLFKCPCCNLDGESACQSPRKQHRSELPPILTKTADISPSLFSTLTHSSPSLVLPLLTQSTPPSSSRGHGCRVQQLAVPDRGCLIRVITTKRMKEEIMFRRLSGRRKMVLIGQS